MGMAGTPTQCASVVIWALDAGPQGGNVVNTYVDSDAAGCKGTRRSISGSVLLVGGMAI